MKKQIKPKDRDYESIIDNLRAILTNLHYSTKMCSACGYVGHEDEDWFCCKCQDEIFCNECYEEEEDYIPLCPNCERCNM